MLTWLTITHWCWKLPLWKLRWKGWFSVVVVWVWLALFDIWRNVERFLRNERIHHKGWALHVGWFLYHWGESVHLGGVNFKTDLKKRSKGCLYAGQVAFICDVGSLSDNSCHLLAWAMYLKTKVLLAGLFRPLVIGRLPLEMSQLGLTKQIGSISCPRCRIKILSLGSDSCYLKRDMWAIFY